MRIFSRMSRLDLRPFEVADISDAGELPARREESFLRLHRLIGY